jgi:hypothetical protein
MKFKILSPLLAQPQGKGLLLLIIGNKLTEQRKSLKAKFSIAMFSGGIETVLSCYGKRQVGKKVLTFNEGEKVLCQSKWRKKSIEEIGTQFYDF